jgi:NADH-quinone oxidoreductase subunit C
VSGTTGASGAGGPGGTGDDRGPAADRQRSLEEQKGIPAADRTVARAAAEGGSVPATGAETDVVSVRRGMFGASGPGDTTGYGGLVRTVTMPPATPAPYGGWFDDVADVLAEVLGECDGPGWDVAVEKVVVDRGAMTLHVRREHLPAVARALRDDPDLRFEMCMGVSGVHYPEEAGRELHAVYPLLSVTHNRRLLLEVACPDDDPTIPSVVPVWPGNDWHEREAWDFFGIVFTGHPALTRIEMPDDWPGHPQRKDYPLGGVPVEYKGAQIPPPDTRRSYR